MTTRGYFWRSSVQSVVKNLLEQKWERGFDAREAKILPANTSILTENRPPDVRESTPRITLSVVDRAEYHRDPNKLVSIVSRVCIGLMRQGYEIRPDIWSEGTPVRRRGPVNEVKLIETFDQFVEEFGDPRKNGGRKK